MKREIEKEIDRNLALLNTEDAEVAFHNLIGLPRTAISKLIKIYGEQDNLEIKSSLIEIIWQFRDERSVPFLITQIYEGKENIWKSAVDGLVTIGGQETIAELVKIKDQIEEEKKDWIEEAIEQIKENEEKKSV